MTASVLAGAAFPPSAPELRLQELRSPGLCVLPGWRRPRRRAGPARMTGDVPKRTRWAGKGSDAGQGKGHSRPGRATLGTPVCTCPGPPARVPPGCGGLAPALRTPGSGVRFFVPAHARPILMDGVRGSPAANRRARLASSASSDPGAPPLRLPTWSGPAPLDCFSGAVAWAASSAVAGPRSRPVASAPIVAGSSGAQDAQAVLPSLPARPSPW